ncbi:MAG TPA: hypothetical protein VJP40_07285 [bacterium]|nr:hypothetical protein [bacterium]
MLGCTGALDGSSPGAGGPMDQVGSTGNAADGTLSSQSDHQPLAGGCGSDMTVRFAGEGKEVENWLIRETDPAFFSKAKVSRVPEGGGDLQPCTDCQGRVLRVVDLGEAPGEISTAAKHRLQIVGWAIALTKDFWSPDLLPAARYRDFVLNASGEAELSGQEMAEDHLYYFLVSKQPMTPVTVPTAFASMQEFNDLATCSNKPNSAPFIYLRLVHALEKPPVDLNIPVHIPQAEDEEEGTSDGPVLIQVPPTENHMHYLP